MSLYHEVLAPLMVTITHDHNVTSDVNYDSQLMIFNGVLKCYQFISFWGFKLIDFINEKFITIMKVECFVEVYDYSFIIQHTLLIYFTTY
jgi:hypothetical protein